MPFLTIQSRSISQIYTLSVALIVFLIIMGSVQAQQISFLKKDTPIHVDPAEKAIGRVMFATRVLVLEEKDKNSLVEITGWHQPKAKRALYAKPGKRIIDLVLKKKATSGLSKLSQWQDPDTELVWVEVSYRGWIKSGNLVSDDAPLWEEAQGLFEKNCTKCHQLRIPHHYTANQWGSHIKVMGPRTGLPKAKQRKILKFLQYRAKDVVAH